MSYDSWHLMTRILILSLVEPASFISYPHCPIRQQTLTSNYFLLGFGEVAPMVLAPKFLNCWAFGPP
jgi:hypothetical protein